MSFDFHKDRDKYFYIQKENAKKYILPFIEIKKKINPEMRILEVGCRDGGVLFPFLEKGCHITGIDLSKTMLSKAIYQYSKYINEGRAKFIAADIHDFDANNDQFDIIILKDVIEHVYDHHRLIKILGKLLNDDGVIYFGYPPWQNPFGGHQQASDHKILSKLPYFHLLPGFLYFGIFKIFKDKKLQFLKATKETRITIEGFRKLIKRKGLCIKAEKMYLINPIYEKKFGWRPIEQFNLIKNIPYLRNYFTTTVDCLVGWK